MWHTSKRLSSILTCQRCEGEVLRLAALPLAVDDVEVDFDRMADGRVSVGRHLHEQHALQDGGRESFSCFCYFASASRVGRRVWHDLRGFDWKVFRNTCLIHTGWLLSLSTVASISQICCPSRGRQKSESENLILNNLVINCAVKKVQLIVSRCSGLWDNSATPLGFKLGKTESW